MEARSLAEIIKYEVPLLPECFRHRHLKRKPKIGVIGEPGSAKSVTTGFLVLKLYFIWGEPVWANMPIKYTYDVPGEIADKYGLEAGHAVFESQEIDSIKLLRMQGDYTGGALVFDEINVKLADSLKTTSNVNFYFNQIDQQLRKDGDGLIYNTIDEMWVDPRLRGLTDIFIKCEDMALTEGGLKAKKPEGVDIRWTVYPMTSMYNGRPYSKYHEADVFYFKASQYWGIVDTFYRQSTGEKYAVDIFEQAEKGDYKEAAMRVVAGLKQRNYDTYPADDLIDLVNKELGSDLSPQKIRNILRNIGMRREGTRAHPGDYVIPSFSLDKSPEIRETAVIS